MVIVMNLDLSFFYPNGTTVYVLPSLAKPRLVIPKTTLGWRWKYSDLYHAFRWQGRVYRQYIRAVSLLGMGKYQVVSDDYCPLVDFIKDVMPQASISVVKVGPMVPTQKATAQLVNKKGEIVGYLKYGIKSAAQKRIKWEHHVLSQLPSDLGPEPLKIEQVGEGTALLLSPLPGKCIRASSWPPSGLSWHLQRMILPRSYSIDKHPYICILKSKAQLDINPWLKKLANNLWPVSIQHGDLTPWNVLRTNQGVYYLIDWEYGVLEGFPYMDSIYYMMAVAFWIQRHSPARAFEDIKVFLTKEKQLKQEEAEAIICLTAYHCYIQDEEDGILLDAPIQQWRQCIWSIKQL